MKGEERKMVCPDCGGANVHIEAVRTLGNEPTLLERAFEDARWFCGRGHAFILSGYCEGGCLFEIALSQHKGDTFVYARARKWQEIAGKPLGEAWT